MNPVEKIRQQARTKAKTIALPEYADRRIKEAARIIEEEKIAQILLLSPDKISPQDKERYIEEFSKIHVAKGWDIGAVKELFSGTLYCAAMMTKEGKVDGFVAGASHTTPDVARAAIRCLGVDARINIATSCFIMIVPHCPYGEEGTFVFADCGIIPEPNSKQLVSISLATAELTQKVLGLTPRIAFLSYSTHGSAKGKTIEKISEALRLIREMAPDLLVDGEIQVDAAIVPEVAKIKYPGGPLGGKANVLIFPNLEAGNISYKLVQRLSNARAVGPLLLGLNKPCSDLSRGCGIDDIVDCVAVTAIRAQ